MSTKLQNFKLPVELVERLEKLSEGNKTSLVIGLLNQSIAMREVNDSLLDTMYQAAKQRIYDTEMEMTARDVRNIIDGLNI